MVRSELALGLDLNLLIKLRYPRHLLAAGLYHHKV